MIPVRLLRPAEVEMLKAATYYDQQANGLGQLFLSSLETAVNSIIDNPNAWPTIRSKIRKRIVSKFPYSILFRVDSNEIVIMAIMHQRRRPDCWLDRI